jgi:hypothetical protein
VDVVKANGQPGHNMPIQVDCSAQIGEAWTPLASINGKPANHVQRSDVKGHVTVTYAIASNVKRLEFKVKF